MNRIVIALFIFSCFCIACSENTKTNTPITQESTEVSFSEHIAPIIFKNCSPCHRDDGPAPFKMLSYKDVAKRAKMVAHVTKIGYMPPWPADPEYRHFLGEKILADSDIALIQEWYKQGAPIGDATKTPPPPVFPKGSLLGTPDMVVKMDSAYLIKGDNTDRFMIMKLPFELPTDTFIKAVEFVPGNKQAVHHMNGHMLRYNPNKKEDLYSGARIIDREVFSMQEAFEALDIAQDDGSYPVKIPSVSNYLPGVQTVIYPKGIGGYYMSEKGSILVNDIHYGPSSKDKYDQSSFNLFFDSIPPKRPVFEIQLGTLGISKVVPKLNIPANEIKSFITEIEVIEDLSLLTINPHMHLLGKKYKAYAVPPSGDTIPLVKIDDWNFRWQYFYTFEKMLKIPKGSIIRVEALFDNTESNLDNPYSPPRLISGRDGSMKTTDEMLQLIISYLPYETGDEHISLDNHSF